MALGQKIARAVLELSTDLTEYSAGLTRAGETGKAFGRDQERTFKSLVGGMSAAGSQASSSGKLIAGMSESGRQSMAQLVTSTKPVQTSFQSIGSFATKLGPMIAGAFSIGAVVGFAKSIGDMAGRMSDLSAETGIGVERLQALNYVGAKASVSVEDIATSVEQLSKRLVGGDKGVVEAIEKLGLNVNSLISMKPDEAFIAIGEAVSGIENPMQRIQMLMELFGRSGAKMGQIMTRDLGEIVEAAEKTSAVLDKELIDRADKFDDAWKQATMRVKGYLAGLVLGPSSKDLQAKIDQLLSYQKAGGKLMPAQADELNSLLDSVNSTELGTMVAGVKPMSLAAAGFGPAGMGGGVLQGPKSSAEMSKAMAAEAEAAKKSAKEAAKLKEAWADANKESVALTANLQKMALGITESEFAGGKWVDHLGGNLPAAIVSASESVEGRLIPAFRAAKEEFGLLIGAKTGQLAGSQGISQTILSLGDKVKGSFGAAFKDLPGTIMAAIQGGGSVTSSVGSLFGASLFAEGGGLATTVTKGFKGLFGESIGKAFSAAIPGLGALIGPAIQGIGKLFGKLFGGEGKKVNDMRDDFIGAAGGIDVLNKKAVEAGTSLDKLLAAKKVKDFEAAVTDLNAKMGSFADEQAADQALLTEALQEFGFTIEQLGPAMRKQELDQQASSIGNKWRVLIGSGIELGLVNEKMAATVNEYLQLALRTGAEVPMALQPILQKMIETGDLVDENGVAITDMGQLQVKWARTMGQEFDRLIVKLETLFMKVFGVGTELEQLPDTVPDPFRNWNIPESPNIVTPIEDDPYANRHFGGMITAHKGRFLGPSLKQGEVLLKALTGEGVLSRMGMQGLGGAGMLNGLNRGFSLPELMMPALPGGGSMRVPASQSSGSSSDGSVAMAAVGELRSMITSLPIIVRDAVTKGRARGR